MEATFNSWPTDGFRSRFESDPKEGEGIAEEELEDKLEVEKEMETGGGELDLGGKKGGERKVGLAD